MRKPAGKTRTHTRTSTRTTPRQAHDELARGKQVERTIGIIDRLAQGPATPDELATQFDVTKRTIDRFMAALERAGVPVYIRQAPTNRNQTHWALDVEKYLAKLRPKDGGGV